MRSTVPFLALFAAALTLGGCPSGSRASSSGAPKGGQPAATGQQAPGFSLKTLDGKTIRLSDLKGEPVVINFWASWCHFCVGEAPDLESLYRQYHPKGLQMLGIGVDTEGAIRDQANQLKLTYPVGVGPQVARSYGVNPIPHTFFINRQGKIVSSVVGARPRAVLEAEVKKIL